MREAAEKAGDALGHALGVGHGDALGHEFAHHDGDVRDDEGDENRGQAVRDAEVHAKAREPQAEWLGKARCGERRREEPNKRDGNLDGSEKLRGVVNHVCRSGRPSVTLLCVMIEQDLPCRGECHLRHREVPVYNREQKRDKNR